MKRIVLGLLTAVVVVVLTACTSNALHYSDFEEYHIASYYQAEHLSNNRYILYYYDSEEEDSKDLEQDILMFLEEFDTLDFYLVDGNNFEPDMSEFGGFDNDPIVYVVSNNTPIETYSGTTEIQSFIDIYRNIDLTDYATFSNQHISNMDDLLTVENADYIVYYYDENNADSEQLKQEFLTFAFQHSVEDIYFVNRSDVGSADTFHDEFAVLQNDLPVLMLMTNGSYANEYYSGYQDVLDYIEDVGNGDIYTTINSLDYSDFSEHILASYNDTLTITNNLHLEYYFSPYCSHCNSIKTQILAFFYQLEDLEFYMINTSDVTGLMKIDDFIGTPSLYVIYQGEIIEEFIGSVAIPEFIDDNLAGEIDYSSYQ